MIGKLLLAVSLIVSTSALTPSTSALTPSTDPLMDHDSGPQMEYLGTYEITAYSYYEGGGENYQTAGGYEPRPWYTVAATEDIPLGTMLWIEGIGEVQVQDRGAFPEGVIDLHIGDGDPEQFGRQTREVYRIRKE